MNILIELELHKGITWPVIELCGVQHTFNFEGNQATVLLECGPNFIHLKNLNKNEHETIVENGNIIQDQIIKIKSFYYDNIQLENDIIIKNSKFFPVYHNSFTEYAKENNLEIHDSLVTDALYFNGNWCFELNVDFWPWYTEKVNEKLCINMDEEQIANYIGIQTASTVEKLKILKQVFNEIQ